VLAAALASLKGLGLATSTSSDSPTLASASATLRASQTVLAEATRSGGRTATLEKLGTERSPTVAGDLTVLGTTLLSDLWLTGKLTTGLLTLCGLAIQKDGTPADEIHTLSGPLTPQSHGLAGLDILDGKVAIDQGGNLTVGRRSPPRSIRSIRPMKPPPPLAPQTLQREQITLKSPPLR
jgi:hypothetical protein